MLNNKQKGLQGEKIASEYIKELGYEILENNYRTKKGEIDIIAYQKNTLIFIEVKLRNSLRYGYPIEAINFRKAKTIKSVALDYIRLKSLFEYPVRFDVIEVFLSEDRNYKVTITENAF
ncbi:YraN family protein [Clostridium cylindrosporum]|uniref:UPF0102 protein CLCY_2c02520 n=1 Tax=Clostridium cylindrosporum DSM 605 TaxID=1121307 RepID=A0A0J8D6L4_CLOCY|nr:YraN family protein [Clostridium cylindrosporum]KMT21492.1 hypothetical protein CLCY_2c02520 [Clostridium cylindrosporum DSM 605]